MQASKSNGHGTRFDTFECLTCDTKIVEGPAQSDTRHGSGSRKS